MTTETTRAAIIGGAIIAASLILAAVAKPAVEGYPTGLAAQCQTQLIAAALVEELALHCPGAADYGHTEGSIALCALARGRSPEQVARLPQCRGIVARLEGAK